MTKSRTNADNVTADIAGITAGTGITGGGTSGTVTITNDMATTIAAKGDLLAGTANDAYSAITVGANGESLVADSSTSTGLRYQSAYNGNVLINGGQDIWQRGTSFTTTAAYIYCSDRWYYSTTSGGKTVSRQATGDTTNLPTIQYCVRLARNSGQTDTTQYSFHTALETADSIPFAGQAVTFSFYARKGANFSGTTIATYINTGTGTDQAASGQNAGTWTGFTSPLNGSTFTPTTTWTRYSFTATIGATATQIGLGFLTSNFSGTAGAADFVEITGLQLERGLVATTFKRSNGAGGTIQGELAACKRYFNRMISASGQLVPGGLYFNSTNSAVVGVAYPVEMRVAPSLIATAANFNISGAATVACSGITLFDTNTQTVTVVFTAAGTPFTFGQSGRVNANTTTSLDWSAEL